MNLKFRNIVICGDVGTGTTTLAKSLAEKLGWQYLSTGVFFREYHREHSIPLWDKMSIPEEVERKIDSQIRGKLAKESSLVVEGHYIGWFTRDMTDILRILLVCDKDTTTQRVLSRKNPEDGNAEEIEKRRQSLREKFRKLYSKDDYEDPNFFHLVIDTSKNNTKETAGLAYNKFISA